MFYHRLRTKIHPSTPPITMIATPNTRPRLDLRAGVASTTVGVSVGDGVMVRVGEGVIDAGPGVNVAVAGGVTARSSFCPGRITDVLFTPFHDIKSISATS